MAMIEPAGGLERDAAARAGRRGTSRASGERWLPGRYSVAPFSSVHVGQAPDDVDRPGLEPGLRARPATGRSAALIDCEPGPRDVGGEVRDQEIGPQQRASPSPWPADAGSGRGTPDRDRCRLKTRTLCWLGSMPMLRVGLLRRSLSSAARHSRVRKSSQASRSSTPGMIAKPSRRSCAFAASGSIGVMVMAETGCFRNREWRRQARAMIWPARRRR